MRKARTFTQEFKREMVKKLVSGTTTPTQLCRWYETSPGLLYHRKEQYILGKLNNEPVNEGVILNKISKLKQLLSKLTLENELLKILAKHSQIPRKRRVFITANRDAPSTLSREDVSS